MFTGLSQDLRGAVRQLVKAPGFAVLAICALALGIGANTAMFTVVQSVLLRPLPYQHPDRLVVMGQVRGATANTTSWLNYRDIRDQSRTLADVAGFSEDVGVVRSGNMSISVVAPGVSANLFDMLGVKPLVGRGFVPEEGQAGGPQVVILSESLWRQLFNGDPNAIGQTIRVNDLPRTVVGVMPASFSFPESMGPDLKKGIWLPIQPTPEMLKDRGYNFFYVLGQLKPGFTAAQLQSELDAIYQHIKQVDPENAGDALRVNSYQETVTGPVRPVFIGLLVALSLVLLIACANVTNLLVARCLGRSHEFAVRCALGASRLRLVRQLMIEGAVLSFFGCVVGFGLAEVACIAVHKLPAGTIPRQDDIALHWSVVLVLAAIATITTVLSSILPALFVSRTDPQPALQAGSRGVGGRYVRGRVSGWLVAGEIALSALLLIGTGLLFRTLWNLEHARLGFNLTNVSYFTAMPSDATGFGNMGVGNSTDANTPSVAVTTYQPLLERMRNTPGVEDAAVVTAPPLSGIDIGSSFNVLGRPKTPGHNPEARVTAVSGNYAQLMGTPVMRGRMITESDGPDAPYVVDVNETLVQQYFKGEDPIGKQIDLGGKDTGMLKPYTIVGVIADQVDHGASHPIAPFIMLPYQQIPPTSLFYPALLKTVVHFVVKTKVDIDVPATMRNVFSQVAPEYALDNFQTLQQVRDENNSSYRLSLYLIAAFAGMAVLMVIAGLYGVLAQVVSYRRREIGVRLALGATRQNILGLVLRQGGVLVLAGVIVGVLISLFSGKLVNNFLFGVKATDGWTYIAVACALALVGLLATFVPAYRASIVEPMEALRDE